METMVKVGGLLTRAANRGRSANSPPKPNPGAAVFVGGIWTLLLLVAVAYIVCYGSQLPLSSDEWRHVPAMTGEQSITPTYLWQLHDGQRLPLPKLLWLGVVKVTDCGDFRAATVLNALALALVVAVKKGRGWVTFGDAFFPLALISLIQFGPFYGSWSLTTVFLMLIACAVLVIMLGHGTLVPFNTTALRWL
jgi:hypothetical protein